MPKPAKMPEVLPMVLMIVGAMQLLVTLAMDLAVGGIASMFGDAWWSRWFPSCVASASWFVVSLVLRRYARRPR